MIDGTRFAAESLSFTDRDILLKQSMGVARGWRIDVWSRAVVRLAGVPWPKGEFKRAEATGNKTSPETQEYDSTDAECSVPCPERISLTTFERGLAVR